MTVADQLIAARIEYDTTHDETKFSQEVKAAFSGLLALSDKDKISAFDKIAQFFINNYEIEELNKGIQYLKSDLDTYLSEYVMQSFFGKNFFEFYNKTYEHG